MANTGFPRIGDGAETGEAITGRLNADYCGHGFNEP